MSTGSLHWVKLRVTRTMTGIWSRSEASNATDIIA